MSEKWIFYEPPVAESSNSGTDGPKPDLPAAQEFRCLRCGEALDEYLICRLCQLGPQLAAIPPSLMPTPHAPPAPGAPSPDLVEENRRLRDALEDVTNDFEAHIGCATHSIDVARGVLYGRPEQPKIEENTHEPQTRTTP